MGDEVELKYSIDDPDAVVAWLDERLPPSPGYGWRTLNVTDTYFDTAAMALANAGYGARLRRHGRRRTVGLKTDISTDGALVSRNELEADATALLDAGTWPPSEARDIVRHVCHTDPLVTRFVLRQVKRRRDYGGLELSVDRVTIRHGRQAAGELTELEVEYKSGRRSEIGRVARLIEKSGLARAEPRSKMTLAAEIVEGPPPIYRGDALAEAGRKVLGRLLDRLVEREMAMRDGDTLALKQMRVATRRMRAAWRSFAGAYRRRDVRRYVDELRAIAGRLGAVRDMDVLLDNMPADDALDGLREAWRDRRESRWQELVSELDSTGYRRFASDYRKLVDTPMEAATARGRSTRVADAAASLIWAAYERVRAAAPPAGPDPKPDQLHALRIAARQFRYTLEAYRELLEPTAYERLMQRLVRLQDLVGELNDADVAVQDATAWIAEQADPQPAVEAYVSDLHAQVGRLSKEVTPAARAVIGITFRRLLGRAVSTI